MGGFDISPEEFLHKLENGELENAMIVDVREPEEWDYYHLDPAVLIPSGTVPYRLAELPKDKELYILCAHGVRSAMVTQYLIQQGYSLLKNVRGGMAAVARLKGLMYD